MTDYGTGLGEEGEEDEEEEAQGDHLVVVVGMERETGVM